ncbi:hypothetical protein PMAYCL1PPCAC_27454, partial [Pristionchus mayeri]
HNTGSSDCSAPLLKQKSDNPADEETNTPPFDSHATDQSSFNEHGPAVEMSSPSHLIPSADSDSGGTDALCKNTPITTDEGGEHPATKREAKE